jgi:hypothetical protein
VAAVKVELKLTGLEGVLWTLQSLPAAIVSKRGGPVKTALRKGALVLLAAEKANLQAIIAEQKKEKAEDTGLLLRSLIATRGKAPSSGKGERYLVRVKRQAYQRRGKLVTTLKTAQILEYGAPGHNQPARPWIRPAFLSNAEKAIRTVERELKAEVDKIVDKVALGL